MVETVSPLVTPEIPVVETVYDEINERRARLGEILTNNTVKQAAGSWTRADGSMCFLSVAAEV